MSRNRKSIVVALTLALLPFGIAGCYYSNSDEARMQMRQESEENCGVMRTVTAYSSTGEQIGQWHGKIDVQYVKSEYNPDRVDVIVFDGSTPIDRIVISGATVIVDND